MDACLPNRLIESAIDLENLVLDIGFLPLVPCGIAGLSVKEHTPPERWFVAGAEGPWEWREEVAARGKVAYGRLLGNKAGFISPAWFGDFANWRRKGMDFDDRYSDGMVSRLEKQVMDLLREQRPVSTRVLRAALGRKGLDNAIGKLQMRTDLLVCRIEYRMDAFGRPYGMGATVLAPAEAVLGEDIVLSKCADSPEASCERIYERLLSIAPDTLGETISSLIS